MVDFLDEVKADADLGVIPTEQKLSRLADLAFKQRELENRIEELQAEMKVLNEELGAVSQKDIPELMQEIGIKEFKLTNGLKVSVRPHFSGKVLGEGLFDWMEANGFADIVKTELVIKSRRTDEDILQPVYELLTQIGIDFTDKDSIHYQTLGAWIKEQKTEGGKMPPEALLEVYTGFKTTIK
jgi:CRISPR/Cas system CMR-associated protein Cmr1 (group 7 of RAMP superfamily)